MDDYELSVVLCFYEIFSILAQLDFCYSVIITELPMFVCVLVLAYAINVLCL